MTINEIYEVIDDSNFVSIENFDNKIIPLFKEFGDKMNMEGKVDFVKLAQIEIDVQNFDIKDNKLSPRFISTGKNGEYFEYPSLRNWNDQTYDYLIQRQNQTKNAQLKAKYSHILWLSPKRHLRFASVALVQYRKIIRKLNNEIWDANENTNTYSLTHNISNTFYLAVSSGNQKEIASIKRLILKIVNKFRPESEHTYINISLVQLMLTNPKVFKKDDFLSLDKKCLKFANKQDSIHSKIDIIKIAEKVSNKLGIRNKHYKEEIAKGYEELSIHREGGTNIASIGFCQDAIKYYKMLKNTSKVKELENRYQELKRTMQLGEFSHEIDLTEIKKKLTKISSDVLKRSSSFIIEFLMYSPLIFPTYEFLYNEANKKKEENSLTSVLGTTLSDEYGHTSAHYQEEEEKIHFSIMQDFSFSIKTTSLILLHEIIFKAIDKGKLNSKIFLNYIRKKSWLGQEISVTHKRNQKYVYNNINTLAPGINDFFSQIYFYYQNPIAYPNFVLAIDSLSLKIEGVLRDICELRGVTTFFQSSDGKGRNIMKEKDINALLRDEGLINILSKDDLMLLQFLLIDKAGWNLRNRIAHSLIRKVEGYGLEHIILLLISILRLAKNEYAPPDKEID